MKKKIYAVKRGWKPGIYMDWLDSYEQIQDFRDAQMRSFMYLEELKDADETVVNSLAYAIKQAEAYLAERTGDSTGDRTDGGQNAIDVLDEDDSTDEDEFMDANDLPDWGEGESSDDWYEIDEPDFGEEDEDEDEVDITPGEDPMLYTADLRKKGSYIEETDARRADEYTRLFRVLKLEDPENGNSPWLELLLDCVGLDKPYVSNNVYTGRYSPASLYVALLYLILDTEKLMDEYVKQREKLVFNKNEIQVALRNSFEYKVLRERFMDLEAIDLSEIRFRNGDLAAQEANSRLVMESKTYKQMKEYIKRGNRTLIDLYDELIVNPVYRGELLTISGPYVNPHIKAVLKVDNEDISMQQLVMQSTAISIELKDVIIGQDEAINKLEKAYFHTEKNVRLNRKKRGPRNVYLFAGPPGVGKTLMAETFAGKLGIPYKRFNMAGYSGKDSVEEIAGISTFWKSAKPGVMTSFVKDNPRCVLLFDEIEKAHSTVVRLFLQVLDEGACFDRFYDGNISFENAIIIFTTNAAKQLYRERNHENLTLLPDRVVIDALEKDINPETKSPYFPPEIVSRMSSHTIIMFNHLEADVIRKVIQKDVEKQLADTEKIYGYDMRTGSGFLAATIQFSAGVNADARNASKLGGKVIDRELYEFLALVEEKHGLDKKDLISQIQWDFDLEDATEEIKEFYFGEQNCVIAVYGQVNVEVCEQLQKNNVQVKATTDTDSFMEIIRKENVILALVDYEAGLDKEDKSLSIVDTHTEGKALFEAVRKDSPDISVYILCSENGYQYSEREKLELKNSGAEDFIDRDNLSRRLEEIYGDVCCRKAIETLALRHQVLTYETRNELDIDRKLGKIIFYNLRLELAIDAEDKSVLLSEDLRPHKKWEDICVADDVKKELTFFIHYLQNPKEYIRKGVRVPKGVLMYGPPGTGKTSLAKVVATESDINFLAMSADQLIQGGAADVHNLFRVARKYAPAVLFLDEIDAIGANRGQSGVSATLNALLTEMDGFKKVDNKPVFIMAATNLGGFIDPALARRFDRTFCVDLPDKEGRRWILERLLKKHGKLFDISENELTSIADRSVGMSPAALENVVETALREGIRSNRVVDDAILDDIFEKCRYGENEEVSSVDEIRHTAYHEAGHALIQMYYGKKPDYLSVVARGNMGGYVLNTEREYHPTRDKLLQRICAMLGGRAAELEFGYGLTPGASSDLQKATDLAKAMVCELGMYEEEVGLAVLSKDELQTCPAAAKQVNLILSEQLRTARSIIDEKRDAMKRLVDAVMDSEQKYLTQKELLEAYHGKL